MFQAIPKSKITKAHNFNKYADRLIDGEQLYHQGIIKNIMISGGNGTLFNNEYLEAKNNCTCDKVWNSRAKDFVEGGSESSLPGYLIVIKIFKIAGGFSDSNFSIIFLLNCLY